MALRQRAEAEAKYYTNPNHCRYCKSVIDIEQGKKIGDTRKKQFCNHSCAAKFTNSAKPKRVKLPKTKVCRLCPTLISNQRMYCVACLVARPTTSLLGTETKGALFKRRSNWQSARSEVRRHAAAVYWNANALKACNKPGCTFTKHIEVCHKRAVSAFPDETTIAEINALENLIGLCPNHHWEFDHEEISEGGS